MRPGTTKMLIYNVHVEVLEHTKRYNIFYAITVINNNKNKRNKKLNKWQDMLHKNRLIDR